MSESETLRVIHNHDLCGPVVERGLNSITIAVPTTEFVTRTPEAFEPAPPEHSALRDGFLDWRGAVEGMESTVTVIANAIARCRELPSDYTDEQVARHAAWAAGLDHVWKHVAALRAAVAAKQAPDVAAALRREADRLIAKADELTASLTPEA